jgi:hypothetical protein
LRQFLNLSCYRWQDVRLKGAWGGPAALDLLAHALSNVARIPVLGLLSGTHSPPMGQLAMAKSRMIIWRRVKGGGLSSFAAQSHQNVYVKHFCPVGAKNLTRPHPSCGLR